MKTSDTNTISNIYQPVTLLWVWGPTAIIPSILQMNRLWYKERPAGVQATLGDCSAENGDTQSQKTWVQILLVALRQVCQNLTASVTALVEKQWQVPCRAVVRTEWGYLG